MSLDNRDSDTFGQTGPTSFGSSSRGVLSKDDTDDIFRDRNSVAYPIYSAENDEASYSLQDFKIIKLIGRGTFGKVYLVKDQRKNQLFAMKSIRKDRIIQQ